MRCARTSQEFGDGPGLFSICGTLGKVDAKAHTFESLLLDGRSYRIAASAAGADRIAAAPLADLTLDLASIWV